ncbi:hypothetical protein GCM10009416_07010 [Craurococcus roseus]|uniref:Uncharacterized protein n=2 Tax=Craurococcus roseus TaxID=77585 RepID=A0ABN1EQM2_9PROT
MVAVVRERDVRTLPFVFRTEAEAEPTIGGRVATGTTIHADGATAWDALHSRFPPPALAGKAARARHGMVMDVLRRGVWERPSMRNVLLACALVLGGPVGCSPSYTPGEYADVGYRAPARVEAPAAPARNRVRAAVRRKGAPAPSAGAVGAARPGAPQAGAGPG